MVMKQPLGPGMSSDMDYTTDRVNEGKQTVHAVFASMETQLPWDLTANYGVRYTWVDSEMNTATASKNGYTRITMPRRTINREYVNVDDGSAGDTGSSDNSRAVFNAGLIWKGIDNLALRATWSQGFRAAILQERYLATSMGGQGTLYGNPDLKPETSNNFEVGARFNNGPGVIDAAAFYSDAKNYITTEYLADGVNSRYVNADKAKTRGLELAASWNILSPISRSPGCAVSLSGVITPPTRAARLSSGPVTVSVRLSRSRAARSPRIFMPEARTKRRATRVRPA